MLVLNVQTLATSLVLALAITSSLGQTVTDVVCFGDGLSGDCSLFTNEFCTLGMPPTISANNTISLCFNHPEGFRCDFTAFRGATTSSSEGFAEFDPTNCVPVLNTVSSECTSELGGSGRVAGDEFFFTIDPNDGNCGSTTAQF